MTGLEIKGDELARLIAQTGQFVREEIDSLDSLPSADVDGHDARAMGPRGVHEALEGKVGEPVKLTLVRGGEVLRVTLKRTPAKQHRLEGDPDPPQNP